MDTTAHTANDDATIRQHWVLQRLARLRNTAKTAPAEAQAEAWDWIESLGRQDNQTALAELFAQGTPESPRTRTDGMPVGPMRNMPGAGIVTACLKIDSPWTGKTFRADGSGGYNRVKRYSRLPVALLAPFHTLRRDGQEWGGFPFDTSVQQGAVEPHIQVLAIEYFAPRHKNPSGLIPLTKVRDELVKILPHTYLGRATYPATSGGYVLVGYFALKRPVTTATTEI